jgi:hypothetical protein
MSLLTELGAFLFDRSYKDIAPTELVLPTPLLLPSFPALSAIPALPAF